MSLRMIALFGLLIVGCSTAASARPIFSTAPEQLIVDQRTGAITYCVPATSGTIYEPVPAGACTKIGTATPNPVNPSLVVSDPLITSDGTTSFITNVYTGQVTQCVYSYVINTKTFYSSCAVIGTAAQ